MRKSIALTIWIGMIVLFSLAFVAVPVLAQDITFYEDPAGRFSMPIGPDWTNESTGEIGRFVSPDGYTVSALAVEATDSTAGDHTVLAAIAPDLVEATPLEVGALPLPTGLWIQALYATTPDRVAALLTLWEDGTTYALLVEADSEATLISLLQHKLQIGLAYLFSVGERRDLTGVPTQPFTEEMLTDLEAYLDEARERFHVAGVSIAIVQNGEVIYVGGSGTTEANGGQPVDADTLFMIGSVTKPITSMVVGSLVDDGVLDWDQPVTDILPSFALSDPSVTAQMRVRDLLNMSSGVPTHDLILSIADLAPSDLITTMVDIPLVSAPGEVWNYSNQMVAAGGFVSAMAAGSPTDSLYEGYVELVQERIFEPIEMPNSTFDFNAAIAVPNHALPYVYDPVSQEYVLVDFQSERTTRNVAPAGAIWSNAEDMARFLQTVVNDGTAPNGQQVISPENLHITQSPEVSMLGPWSSYGMGWIIDTYEGLPLLYHPGNTNGFSSKLAFLPSADLGVVILTNGDAAAANDLTDSVRDYVFELAFGLEHDSAERYAASHQAQIDAVVQAAAAAEAAPAPAAEVSIDAEAVAPFLGEYEYGVTVEMRGNQLWLVGAYVEAPLFPANGSPNTEAGDFIGTGAFAGTRVRFIEDADQKFVEIVILYTGETVTFDAA
jgi:CubicO group peptidase (beta-lactamase class C family)